MMMASFPLYRQADSNSSTGDVPYLFLTLAFTTVVFAFEFWLDLRQLAKFDLTTARIPARLVDVVKQETFSKSIAYRKDMFSFKLIESSVGFLLSAATILGGYLPWAWDSAEALSAALVTYTGSSLSAFTLEVLTTWLFIVVFTCVDSLLTLPFSLYSTFVLEERHGFNKTTLILFIQDKLMMLALTFGLSLPVLAVVIYIVQVGGEHFYFFVWAFLCAVSVLLMTVYPTWIAPMFNKYTLLDDGEVKEAIEELAKQVEFPLTQIFSVDGSKRSAHSNAYFYGFFKSKRIVLYDTLLKQVEMPELLAILGHEIGHWKLWHTLQNFIISQLYTFCLFLAFSFVQNSSQLFTAFGFAFHSPMPVFVGLMLFAQTFWGPVDKLLSLVLTLNSRSNEFAADAFAVTLGRGKALVGGLIKISTENLDNLVPDAWYSWYHYSHPPLVERIAAVEKLERKGM